MTCRRRRHLAESLPCHITTILPHLALPNCRITVLPYHIAALPHCHIATLPHCHIATLPHCHIATLPHCHIATLPHCHIATLPHCRIAALPHCHIATLPHCHIATLPHCHIAASPHCHIATLPHRRITTSPHHRITASPHHPIANYNPLTITKQLSPITKYTLPVNHDQFCATSPHHKSNRIHSSCSHEDSSFHCYLVLLQACGIAP
jgi:hypothetical protein